MFPIGIEEELPAALGAEKDVKHGRLLSGVEQRKEKEEQRRLNYIPVGWKVNIDLFHVGKLDRI
jgi:hypothetical protein